MKTPVKSIHPGDTVAVHMNDGRNLRCEVLCTYTSVAGPKIKVQSGSLILTVNPDQIIEVLK